MPPRRDRRETDLEDGAATTASAATSTTTPPSPQPIAPRREQYLVARRPGPLPAGVQPLDFRNVRTALEQDPEITIKRTLISPGLEPLAAGLAGSEAVVVAEMTPQRVNQLRQVPQLVVEVDHPLVLSEPDAAPPLPPARDPGVVVPLGTGTTITIAVTGRDGTPVEGALVFLYGSLWPVQGTSDAQGLATLTLIAESPQSVRGLYVKPRSDYWSLWMPNPALEADGVHVVTLTPLDQTFAGFPSQEMTGWGLRAMRLDQLPPSHRGQGVRIAIVDSGAATTHPDLERAVKGGYDTIAQNDRTWTNDEISHGSHCAGVIAGQANNGGVQGIAPDADVYAIKIFPGGRFSSLLDALNRCLELQVDVVNLSLGSDQYSELLEQKIDELKTLGIACVVAAGNTGGAVQYPASSPNVLAVAAIGKQGEFPADSYHATVVRPDAPSTPDGFFAASFSCVGPEIDVCAPGVAILSSVPPKGWAAWDGTSMAAPHVTGLAALVLAHHPDFQGAYKTRNARRVDRLFEIVKQSCRPLELGDVQRTGAGLPDAMQALLGTPRAAPETLTHRLVAALRETAPALGESPVTVSQLMSALQRAGIPTGPVAQPMAAGPDMPRAGMGGTITPQPMAWDRDAALERLRAAVERAGLISAKQAAALRKGRRPTPATGTPRPAPARPEAAARPVGTTSNGGANGTGDVESGSAVPAGTNGNPVNRLARALQKAGL